MHLQYSLTRLEYNTPFNVLVDRHSTVLSIFVVRVLRIFAACTGRGPTVSKLNDGRLVFNAFIDKEYAPRGRHAL